MKNWKLIQKYIFGNAGLEERRKVQQWMEKDPENKKLVQQLEQIWEMTPEEDFEVDVKRAWDRFNKKKIGSSTDKFLTYSNQNRSDKMVYLYRVAAVVLLALFVGYFVQYNTPDSSDSKTTAQFYLMENLTTGKGEKASIRFSDGTEVILNAATSIRFPKQFKGSNREVHLDGEAYFKVAHDSDHPFMVHVHGTTVQVLGTEFNVRGWESDSSVDVAVREGKVSVAKDIGQQSDKSEVILTRGELTRVHEEKGILSIRNVEINDYLLWISGGMYFDNVPFKQVVSELERKFDVEITVKNEALLDVPFTSTFKRGELDKILNVIAASMKIEYSRDGSKIEFK